MSAKPWGGAFEQPTDQLLEQFSESVSFDHQMYAHDVRGSVAHARMLAKVGMLTGEECDQIVAGLEAIRDKIAVGEFAFSTALEDVHMNIERALVDRIGDVGRKLHTGRSRKRSGFYRLSARDSRRDRPPGRPATNSPAGVRASHQARRGRAAARLHAHAASPTSCGESLLASFIAKNTNATATAWPIAAAV